MKSNYKLVTFSKLQSPHLQHSMVLVDVDVTLSGGKKGTNSTLSNFSKGTNTYTSDTTMYHLGVKMVQVFTF